jgi:rare lipoprotein A
MHLRPFAIAAAIAVTTLTAPAAAFSQATAPVAPTGGATATSTGGLTVTSDAMSGDDVDISGTLTSAANAGVRVERQDPDDGTWEVLGRAKADASGAFTVTWEADTAGRWTLRAVPDTTAATTATIPNALPGTLTIYKPTRATWYGLFGRTTACGVKLTKTTMGVAHKTLPCGTMVAVELKGRTIEVPVIDRGPYAKGVALDLTWAAAQAIGMPGTDQVGWTALPSSTTATTTPAPTTSSSSTTSSSAASSAASVGAARAG